jgi:hypothetical protein
VVKRNLQYEWRAGPVRFPGRRLAESQNGRLSWSCGVAGNFGFRGLIGLSGLDLFVSFWGNAKKNNKNILFLPKVLIALQLMFFVREFHELHEL